MRKIVLVGAGSAVFTRGLVADLIADQGEWRVGLVDINPEALETAQGLCQRMVEITDAPLVVEGSTDRCDILPGADVVVTTIAVGGRRAREQDVFIPRRHGLYQPVGDTVSVGGISRALRMIPAMVDIARDVLRLCPQSLLINYSNPMSCVCRAVRRATGAEIIGLCHGVPQVHGYLADFLGLPEQELESVAVGVNHLTWFTELTHHGRDLWPLVDQRLDRGPGSDNPFSWGLYRAFRAFPAVLDRHVTEFFPPMMRKGAYYGQTLGVDAFSLEENVARGDQGYAAMREQALGLAPLDQSILHRAPGEGEKLLEILNAIWADNGQVYSANLPNTGQVPNLPADVVLESPCAATGGGLVPLPMPELPPGLAAIMSRVVMAQELTVEAALSGQRRIVEQALLADGSLVEPGLVGRVLDEMLAAHAAYLPQFA